MIFSLFPGQVQVIGVVPSNRGTVWLYHHFRTRSVASSISLCQGVITPRQSQECL